MSLRIFEEPVEAVESPQQLEASFAARTLFCIWASLVAAIPAFVTSYAGLAITNVFRSMTNAENASTAVVLDALHRFNRPVIITLGISAFLSFALALVIATNPRARLASVGLPFSIAVPIIAALPAVILWFSETTTIDVLSGKITNSPVESTAQTISSLLFSAIALGLLAQGATLICAIVSLFMPLRKRSDPLSLGRAFVWAVSGTLLLVFAAAYFVIA
jgi:hypothetical protein